MLPLKKLSNVVLTPEAFAVPKGFTLMFNSNKLGVKSPYNAGNVSSLLNEKSNLSTLVKLACGKSVMLIDDSLIYLTLSG